MKDDEKIACHICKKEIPKAAAVHSEGQEYVLHFCNVECMDYWKEEGKKKRNRDGPADIFRIFIELFDLKRIL